MSTSGTVTYRTTRNQVLDGSLRLVGAYDPENSLTPTATQYSTAAEALNLITKQHQANGLQLYCRKNAVVFPQKDQRTYVLGSPGPGGDHASLVNTVGLGGFVYTNLTSGSAAGASTVVVDTISSDFSVGVSVVSITTAYNIGIELDSGAIQWTTVNGAPSGTTVTLAATLTGAAAAGNVVYCYQTKLTRPLRVLDGWISQLNTTRSPVRIIAREQYNRFSDDTASGVPVQMMYDPQSNSGYLKVYPGFQSVRSPLYIEFQKAIEDITGSGDDYDMPQEWGNYLKFQTALTIAPEYEIGELKFKQISFLAEQAFTLVDGWDQEATSMFLQPEWNGR